LSIVDGQNNDITASVIFISSDGLTVSNGNLECNMVSTKYVLKSDGYEGDQKYLVTATIPQSCNVCSRSGFVFYGDDSPIAVPDANLVVVVLVVCLALFMILRKRI